MATAPRIMHRPIGQSSVRISTRVEIMFKYQRTEDREQRTEDREERTEDRGQRAKVRDCLADLSFLSSVLCLLSSGPWFCCRTEFTAMGADRVGAGLDGLIEDAQELFLVEHHLFPAQASQV